MKMKNMLFCTAISTLVITGFLTGCGPKDPDQATTTGTTPPAVSAVASPGETKASSAQTVAVVTGLPKGSLKIGERAVCAVCAVKEGTKETEEVKDVLDYKGKTYGFCNESEKAEFISEPAKYAQLQ